MNTAKRKKLAAARDAKFLKSVYKLAESFKGEGIWSLFQNARMSLLRLLPPSVLPKKRAPRSSHCGSVEKLGFQRSDARHPRHEMHLVVYHGAGPCDCVGVGHPRKSLKSPLRMLLNKRDAA